MSGRVMNIAGVLDSSRSVIPLLVATNPDSWTPSRRLRSAAHAERERVARTLGDLDRRRTQLAHELAHVDASREQLREQLDMLTRLVAEDDPSQPRRRDAPTRGEAPGGSDRPEQTPSDLTMLRGQAIRETAVRALIAAGRGRDAVHYKEWFELLRDAGFMPVGKDPLATFLTQLGRSPVIARSTEQGVYRVDDDFLPRARRQLDRLRADLREAQDAFVGDDVAEVVAMRERRSELTSEVERFERALEEALRSLAPATHDLRAVG